MPIGSDGVQNVFPVGSANGNLSCEAILKDCEKLIRRLQGTSVKKLTTTNKGKRTKDFKEGSIMNVMQMPQAANEKLTGKSFIDYQNDVKVTDVSLAIREGFESVEHTKRYTTLGMASDQGKLSNINGINFLAKNLGKAISEVGTTTFRPPYVPISLDLLVVGEREI